MEFFCSTVASFQWGLLPQGEHRVRTSVKANGFNQATVGLHPRLADPQTYGSFLMLSVPYQMNVSFSSKFTARQRLRLVVPRYRRPVTCR